MLLTPVSPGLQTQGLLRVSSQGPSDVAAWFQAPLLVYLWVSRPVSGGLRCVHWACRHAPAPGGHPNSQRSLGLTLMAGLPARADRGLGPPSAVPEIFMGTDGSSENLPGVGAAGEPHAGNSRLPLALPCPKLPPQTPDL